MKFKTKNTLFYVTKYERHLIINYEHMINIGVDATLDLLLDHGFTTKMELTRFDDSVQNIVEFVQDLYIKENDGKSGIKFKYITDIEPGGDANYH